MKRTAIISTALIAALALTGCQTTAEYQARQTAELHNKLLGYRGQTVGDLMREQAAFSVQGYDEITSTRRMYIFASQPMVSTVYVPPYIPNVGTFNDPAMARAAGNLATLHTVPGVAQSTVRQCRLHVDAEQIDDEPSPDSRRIRNVDYSGNNC